MLIDRVPVKLLARDMMSLRLVGLEVLRFGEVSVE
jgi:hypothetical protein